MQGIHRLASIPTGIQAGYAGEREAVVTSDLSAYWLTVDLRIGRLPASQSFRGCRNTLHRFVLQVEVSPAAGHECC